MGEIALSKVSGHYFKHSTIFCLNYAHHFWNPCHGQKPEITLKASGHYCCIFKKLCNNIVCVYFVNCFLYKFLNGYVLPKCQVSWFSPIRWGNGVILIWISTLQVGDMYRISNSILVQYKVLFLCKYVSNTCFLGLQVWFQPSTYSQGVWHPIKLK